MNLSVRKIGFAQIILSGICFGFLGLFGKMAYQKGIAPGELLALRYLLSAILMGIFLLLKNPRALFKLSAFEVISSLLLGIFGYALFSSLYFLALTGISASLTVLLLYTYPLIVMVFSHFFLKERMGIKGILAAFLVMTGLLGLVYGEWSVSHPLFLIYGIGSAFFYAIYIVLSRKYLSDVAPIPSSFYVQLGAGLILSLLHFSPVPYRSFEILSHHALLIFSMAIICSFMAMTLFLAGLQKITSFEASLLSTTEPISGVIIATLFLGEKIQGIQIIGAILILSGLIVMARRNGRASA